MGVVRARRRRSLLTGVSVLAVCSVVVGAPVRAEEPVQLPQGKFSAHCFFVAHLKADPFGHYDDLPTPAPHVHTFSAFESPSKIQKPADLRSALPNECLSPDLSPWQSLPPTDPLYGEQPDKSSYWVPALYSTNVSPADWADPSAVLVYYSSAGVDPNDVQPFPQDPKQMVWSCVAATPAGVANEVNFGPTIPHTCPKLVTWVDEQGQHQSPFMLRLIVKFPNCVTLGYGGTGHGQWNPAEAEYAITNPDPQATYPKACPDPADPTKPLSPIPQVHIGYRWDLSAVNGLVTDPRSSSLWDLSSLKVASDMSNLQNSGVSGHADFMSGWSDPQLTELMKTCFWDSAHGGYAGSPRNCGYIGDTDEVSDY